MTRIEIPPPPAGYGWTAARVIALVTGSVLLLISLALLAGGGTLAWADEQQHHSGYLTTSTAAYSTQGYALASDAISLHGSWAWLGLFVDKVRIRISSEPSRPLFAGIARVGDVQRYLAGVGYTQVSARGEHEVAAQPGAGIPAPPATALPWPVRAEGSVLLGLVAAGLIVVPVRLASRPA